jgi:DNA helicase-2/ATP-dependent DNA helicase PcrA
MHDLQITNADIDQLLEELNHGIGVPEERLRFDEARRSAITNYHDVQACPGSGKTTLIGFKLLLLARRWSERHTGICVLTHCNIAKEEILNRLRQHPAGYKLLTYPHFVGTIQDFVNTFLALPFARSRGWEVRLLDSTSYAERVSAESWKKVRDSKNGKQYRLQYYFNQKKISPHEFHLVHVGGVLGISESFLASAGKHVDIGKSGLAADYFLKKREQLCEQGIFQYREMYALAEQAIHDNAELIQALRDRFPIVILDEMQDTQKFQDDLINCVFPAQQCCIQRLGDPDQSIFDGIGGELPNVSFNDGALAPIIESHRLSPEIAMKITGLSYSQLPEISTSRVALDPAPVSSLILYDDASIGKVLNQFADLVIQLPVECRKTVRALGAVAKEPGENDLTIKSYWPQFENSKSPKSFEPATLIQAVRYCSEQKAGHVAERYQILIHSVLSLLRRAGKTVKNKAGKSVLFSQGTWRQFLRDNEQELAFRELLAEWIMSVSPSEEKWVLHVERLKHVIGLDEWSQPANDFLVFECAKAMPVGASPELGNVHLCHNGVRVEMSTIHAAKGETHDATLILETRYRLFDIQEMVQYLCDANLARPVNDPTHPTTHSSIRASFMKRLYVAASRPRYLLCLAMHKDRLPADKKESLRATKGWNVIEL